MRGAWSSNEQEIFFFFIFSLSRIVKRHGVAKVLDRLLQIKALCVLVCLREDCLSEKVLQNFFHAAKTIVTIQPDEVVQMVVKKKGGKVLRTNEKILDWKVRFFILFDFYCYFFCY
jgi:hypothetical protein